MKVNRYAELFPMMPDNDLRDLADDIKTNGQRHPIVLDQDGVLIDGRCRLAACQMADVEPAFATQHFASDDEVRRFVISVNLARRHLSESQRAMIAGRLTEVQQGRRNDLETSLNSKKSGPQGLSQEEAAKDLNVSTYSVNRARKVLKDAVPEIVQMVEAGEVSVSAAAVVADLEPEEQEEVAAGGPEAVTSKSTEQRTKKKGTRKRAGSMDTVLRPKGYIYQPAPADSFQKMVETVKGLGRVPKEEFYAALGDDEHQRWFPIIVAEVHYMHLLEDEDGTIELFIDDSERDLCTAIEKQLERIQHGCQQGNKFKFDFALYRKLTQDLYDLVRKASTHKTEAKCK